MIVLTQKAGRRSCGAAKLTTVGRVVPGAPRLRPDSKNRGQHYPPLLTFATLPRFQKPKRHLPTGDSPFAHHPARQRRQARAEKKGSRQRHERPRHVNNPNPPIYLRAEQSLRDIFGYSALTQLRVGSRLASAVVAPVVNFMVPDTRAADGE